MQNISFRILFLLIAVSLMICLSASGSFAQTRYRYITIDYPGASFTDIRGINNLGDIVGNFETAEGRHGFLYDGSEFYQLESPPNITEDMYVRFGSINSSRIIKVGIRDFSTDPHTYRSYLYDFATSDFNEIIIPGLTNFRAMDINDAGQLVIYDLGEVLGDQIYSYFIYDGEQGPPIEYPGAEWTEVYAINNNGHVAGTFGSKYPNYNSSAFIYDGTAYTPIQFEEVLMSPETGGLNNAHQMVILADNVPYSFLYYGGRFERLMVPGAVSTTALDINNDGIVVGVYRDSSDRFHGFIAIPTEVIPIVPQILPLLLTTAENSDS